MTLSAGLPAVLPGRYAVGKRQLEQAFGVEVVEVPFALATFDEVAAHPERRAADLMAAFADPSIAGIISTIGGDDSMQILPYLDFDVIASNPKVVLGYSDTTMTHLACLRAGLMSFYGPSIMSGFAENGGLHRYLERGVRTALFDPTDDQVWPPNDDGWTVELLDWADPANQAASWMASPASCSHGPGVRSSP